MLIQRTTKDKYINEDFYNGQDQKYLNFNRLVTQIWLFDGSERNLMWFLHIRCATEIQIWGGSCFTLLQKKDV